MHLAPVVLLADPDEDARHALARVLREQGLDTLCARDDVECIDQALRHKPDVLVIALASPELHAIRLVRALLVLPWFEHVCKVALATKDDCVHYRAALAGDFQRVLVKPVLPSDVAGLVQELLGSERTTQLA